jgi:glycerol uptake facilitator-like aquaporin
MYKYLAEFFGTLTFVYIVLATGNPLAIGASLSLVLLFTHNISKGGVNPAVAIAMASAGQIESRDLVPYCLAQIFGGLTALELYKRYQL